MLRSIVDVSNPCAPKSGFVVIGSAVVLIGWAVVLIGCAAGAGLLLLPLHAARASAARVASKARRIWRPPVGFCGANVNTSRTSPRSSVLGPRSSDVISKRTLGSEHFRGQTSEDRR